MRPLQQSPAAPHRSLTIPTSPVITNTHNINIDDIPDMYNDKHKLSTRNIRSSSMATTTDATIRTPRSNTSIPTSCWSPLGLHSSPDQSIPSPSSISIGHTNILPSALHSSTIQQQPSSTQSLSPLQSSRPPPSSMPRGSSNLRVEKTNNLLNPLSSPNKPINWSNYSNIDNSTVMNTESTKALPRDSSYDDIAADEQELLDSTKFRITPSPDIMDPYFNTQYYASTMSHSTQAIHVQQQQRIDELCSELHELRHSYEIEKQARRSSDAQCIELNNSLKLLQSKYIRAQQSLHQLVEHKHDIKSHADINVEYDKLKLQIQLVEKQLDDSNTERSTLSHTVEKLQHERSVILRDNLKLQIEVDELNKQCNKQHHTDISSPNEEFKQQEQIPKSETYKHTSPTDN